MIFPILVSLLLILSIHSFHLSGDTLYDLEFQGLNFITEAEAWECTAPLNSTGVKTTQCGSDTILGGYNVMGLAGASSYGQYWYRTYAGLPSHNSVKLQVKVYPIDSWEGSDNNDHFEIAIDGANFVLWTLRSYDSSGFAVSDAPTDICGSPSFNDLPYLTVYITLAHSANTLDLQLINGLDEGSENESVGFRDIVLVFSTESSPVSTAYCGITSSGYPLSDSACDCGSGTTMSSPDSGLCGACDPSCATCNDASSSDCLTCLAGDYLSSGSCLDCAPPCDMCSGDANFCISCQAGYGLIDSSCYLCEEPLILTLSGGVYYCQSPCEASEFVLWDGSCSLTCDSPLITETVGAFNLCTFPCSDETLHYYNWNSSCISGCPYPLSESSYLGRYFCDYVCDSTKHLYWNGSCLDGCPPPLTSEVQGVTNQRNFCWYSCPPSQYLYWNGSCLGECPDPLSKEIQGTNTTRQFCWYPCPSQQYLYWNGSCLTGCPSPLTSEVQGTAETKNFCWYTCPTGQHLYWNGSCLGGCPYPLIPETQGATIQRDFCWYPCSPSEYLYWNGSCIDKCPSPLSVEIQGTTVMRNFCWYTCHPNQYLYWNGSCIDNCPSPLTPEVQGTNEKRNFCWYTCPTDQRLYWNGSCLADCPSPLVPETQGTTVLRDFCWYTCSPSYYLYWNGSCVDKCPSPLSTEVQGTTVLRNFCWYPCPIGQHLYWNGSCLTDCPPPLVSETQGTGDTRKFCWYPCQPTEYLYWNGSCIDKCPSPLSSEVQGTTMTRKFCWYTCPINQYLYWNASCLTDCPSPLTPEVQGTTVLRNFCWYTCSPSYYLYWNGSCVDQCPSPLTSEIQGTTVLRNFCWYTCPTNQHLYWNGSCLTDCPSSLSPEVQGTTMTRKFCWYTCQPHQHLYWNSSCIDNCPSPLSPETQGTVEQRNFCWFPCQPGQYLSWNGSCLSNCTLPLMILKDPGISYCFLPCPPSSIYWYKNNSCLPKCSYPYNIVPYSDVLQCLSPCKDSEYYYEKESKCYSTCSSPFQKILIDVVKVCHSDLSLTLAEAEAYLANAESIKTQGSYTSGAMKASSAISSSNPASALLAGLSSMLQYIRYMNINYPTKVQVLFLVAADNPISFAFDFQIPDSLQDRLVDYSLPECFEKYGINSNFLNNMWDFLMTLMLIFVIILAVVILEVATKKYTKINKIIGKILQILKWNTPLAMICSSSGDIFFYSSLQFMSSPLDSTTSIVCFIICLVMILSVLALWILTLKIMKSFHRYQQRKSQKDFKEKEDWKEKYSSCEILFAQYEETTVLTVGYMALFILRGSIFNLTIANLHNFPLAQSIIINIVNLLMFGYILYLRPLKELLEVVQLFVTEGVINVVSICVLILAIMDKANIQTASTRRQVGNVMAFLIQAFNTLALAFMAISIILFLLFTFRIWRLLRAQGIKSPLKMLEKVMINGIDIETLKAAGIKNSLVKMLTQKPKIRRPPKREKPPVNQRSNGAPVLYLESLDNSVANLPIAAGRSGNDYSEESFVQNRSDISKLQPTGEELDTSGFYSIQTVFEPYPKEDPERSFQGFNETVGDIQNTEGNVSEMRATENGEEVSLGGSPLRRIGMVEDWNELKSRMKKFTSQGEKVRGNPQLYNQLKKLKTRLKNRPNKPGINLEDFVENS